MSVESLISCPKMNLKGDFSDTPPRERLAHKYPAACTVKGKILKINHSFTLNISFTFDLISCQLKVSLQLVLAV